MTERYAVTHLSDVPVVPDPGPGEPDWKPLRHWFGLEAFGVNVFVARAEGDQLVVEHCEATDGESHEELYLVLGGDVTFTVDGESFQAPGGTLVAVGPAVRRGAVARSEGASILAIGGSRDRPHEISRWDRKWTSTLRQA